MSEVLLNPESIDPTRELYWIFPLLDAGASMPIFDEEDGLTPSFVRFRSSKSIPHRRRPLVNLVTPDGNPSEVMDMSFANQFLSVLKLAESKGSLQPIVYDIPREQDQEIALAKLKSMNIDIDTLTQEQEAYLNGFSQGT